MLNPRIDHGCSKPNTEIPFPAFPNLTVSGSDHVIHFWPIRYEGKSGWGQFWGNLCFSDKRTAVLFLPLVPLSFIEEVRSVAAAAIHDNRL